MHEFVLSGAPMKRELGIRTLDLAKRLLDYGFHPPTVYFPLLVDEALLIEPTETETKETLDAFADVDRRDPARGRARIPTIARNAPYTTPVRRLDEARRGEAAGHPPAALAPRLRREPRSTWAPLAAASSSRCGAARARARVGRTMSVRRAIALQHDALLGHRERRAEAAADPAAERHPGVGAGLARRGSARAGRERVGVDVRAVVQQRDRDEDVAVAGTAHSPSCHGTFTRRPVIGTTGRLRIVSWIVAST